MHSHVTGKDLITYVHIVLKEADNKISSWATMYLFEPQEAILHIKRDSYVVRMNFLWKLISPFPQDYAIFGFYIIWTH